MTRVDMRLAMRALTFVLVALAGIVAMACVQVGAPATPDEPAVERVTVRLDWLADGYHTAFFVARAQGYYEEVGLEVEINDGQGSGNAIQLVGTGNDTFGFVDGGALVRSVAADIPVQNIATFFPSTPLGLAAHAEADVNEPKDLEGKTYGAVLTSATHQLWPAFVERNEIDTDTITIVNVEPATADQMVLTRLVDFTDAFAGGQLARWGQQGHEGTMLLFGEWGLNVVGHGIVAHTDTIENNPDMVRRFVEATMRGLDYARNNPQEAIDILLADVPTQNQETALFILEFTAPLLESDETAGRPLGSQPEQAWATTIEVLADTGTMPRVPEADEVYTSRFLE